MIGIGLYDAKSPIQIKMIYAGSKRIAIDQAFFYQRIQQAFNKRLPLLEQQTNSYRLLFGENDGFSGLIADVYDKVLVVKLYSAIWLPYLHQLLDSLQAISRATTTVIRLSRQLQKNKQHTLQDGSVVNGVLENEVVPFLEHGILFSANVIKGHKTGYFLDHRHNRKRVGELSTAKTVLDVFSYAGGFSVHALAHQALEVTSLDISKQALEIAKENARLNPYSGKHHTIAGDAFEEMKKFISSGTTYDVVVIDPPSFAKQQSEVTLALKKYAELALLGVQLTAKNGILVLASCSSRVSKEDFFKVNQSVLQQSNRNYKTSLKTTHDIDHPISFPEGAYLKCAYYQMIDE